MNTNWIRMERLNAGERKHALREAGRIIREGGLVAFPTETVYGLGADALNAEAAAKIYKAKGRPSDNPLIIHISDVSQVYNIAKEVPETARILMKEFWPGPLTIILWKKAYVPDGTTGGLPTVAIRMPSHPVARAFIRESGRVIAAPSANTSGRPSPTMAEHVYEDMNGRIPMILDGGPVDIGIESTIIDLTGEKPIILRPGFISRAMLSQAIGPVGIDPAIVSREPEKEDIIAKAPGMKYRHYAPKGELTLIEGSREAVRDKINSLVKEKIQMGYKVGVIATDETIGSYHGNNPGEGKTFARSDPDQTGTILVEGPLCRSIGSRDHPETVAASLYRILREFDSMECDYIYSESFFEEGLGNAIMNRMLKAAGYHLISLQED